MHPKSAENAKLARACLSREWEGHGGRSCRVLRPQSTGNPFRGSRAHTWALRGSDGRPSRYQLSGYPLEGGCGARRVEPSTGTINANHQRTKRISTEKSSPIWEAKSFSVTKIDEARPDRSGACLPFERIGHGRGQIRSWSGIPRARRAGRRTAPPERRRATETGALVAERLRANAARRGRRVRSCRAVACVRPMDSATARRWLCEGW